jgi:hypothetical protein
MALEQLYYTWGAFGLSGANRFQIVAASPRLVEASPLQEFALRLCTYDVPPVPPGVPPPPSFGWVDFGEHLRVGFRRGPAGADARGTYGNIAAHIVAGPRDEMGVANIAASFDSACWWAGDPSQVPSNALLDTLADLAVGPVPETLPRIGAVAEALLSRRQNRIWFPMGAPELMGTLARLATDMPGLLDGVAVSTYETSRLAEIFQVIGSTFGPLTGFTTPQRRAKTDFVRMAGDFIGRNDLRSRNSVVKVWTEHLNSGGSDHAVAILAIRELAERGDTPSADQIAQVLLSPTVAVDALDRTFLRRAAASALATGHVGVARGITTAFPSLAPEVRLDLAQALGRASTTLSAHALNGLATAASQIDPSLLPVIVATLLAENDQRSPVAEWNQLLIAAALQVPDVPDRIRASLIERATAFVVQLANSSISDSVYAQIVAAAVELHPPHPGAIAEALLRHPERLAAVVDTLGLRAIRDLLARLRPQSAVLLVAEFPRKDPDGVLADVVLEGLEQTRSLDQAEQLLLGIRRSLRPPHSVVASGALILVQRLRDEERHTPDRQLDFDRIVRIGEGLSQDQPVSAWRAVARELGNGYGHVNAALVDALYALRQVAGPPGLQYALEGSVVSWISRRAVGSLLSEIVRRDLLSPADASVALLNGALRGARAYSTPGPAGTALSLVAWLLDEGRLETSGLFRGDRLKDATIQHYAERVVSEMWQWPSARELLSEVQHRAAEDGRRWLHSIGVSADRDMPRRSRAARYPR